MNEVYWCDAIRIYIERKHCWIMRNTAPNGKFDLPTVQPREAFNRAKYDFNLFETMEWKPVLL